MKVDRRLWVSHDGSIIDEPGNAVALYRGKGQELTKKDVIEHPELEQFIDDGKPKKDKPKKKLTAETATARPEEKPKLKT